MDPSPLQQMPVLDPATQAIVDALRGAYEQGGWLAVGGLALTFFVRLVRMTEGGAVWWDSLSTTRKRAVAFVTAAVGGGIVIVSVQHVGVSVAVPGALISGAVGLIASGLFHHGTEKMAELAKVRLTGNPKTDALLKLAFGHELEGPAAPPAATEPTAGTASSEPSASSQTPPGGAA